MAKMKGKKRRKFIFLGSHSRIIFIWGEKKKRMKESLPSNLCDMYVWIYKREDEDDLAI